MACEGTVSKIFPRAGGADQKDDRLMFNQTKMWSFMGSGLSLHDDL